jgi:hypothetical protein
MASCAPGPSRARVRVPGRSRARHSWPGVGTRPGSLRRCRPNRPERSPCPGRNPVVRFRISARGGWKGAHRSPGSPSVRPTQQLHLHLDIRERMWPVDEHLIRVPRVVAGGCTPDCTSGTPRACPRRRPRAGRAPGPACARARATSPSAPGPRQRTRCPPAASPTPIGAVPRAAIVVSIAFFSPCSTSETLLPLLSWLFTL